MKTERSTRGVAYFFGGLIAIILLTFLLARLAEFGRATTFAIFSAIFIVLFATGLLARFARRRD
jgi:VIT1/CCC1 family predicted Fe2+/Mn2+ transporter